VKPLLSTRRRPGRQLLLLGALLALPYSMLMQGSQVQRLGIDLTLPMAEFIAPDQPTPPVAVVVIDEDTYQRFKETPQVAWTPLLGEALQAVDAAGAKVVGFDLVYPTTLESLIPGYDRRFLTALHSLGQEGRLVLGYAQTANGAIEPHPGQIVAVGGGANLRPVNLERDGDEVVRRYPAGFPSNDGRAVTSFAAELVRRFGMALPTDYFLIDFTRDPARLPIYSLADVLQCSRHRDNADVLRDRLAGRIVLIGTALDVEDRHLTARRFSFERTPLPDTMGCTGVGNAQIRLPTGRSSPGVFIHAAAVETLLAGQPLQGTSLPVNAAMIGGTWALIVLVLLRHPPLVGVVVAGTAMLAVYTAAALSASQGLVIPFLDVCLAIATAYVATYAYRFVMEQDAHGLITRQFGRYVSPTVVRRLADRRDDATLDGEVRVVTVAFFDISGFTALSEQFQHAPRELLDIANLYLGRVADLIRQHRGYVDKFTGDGVMAIWGAPDHNHDAASHAIDAALACQRLFSELNDERMPRDADRLQLRVGINTGTAIVGNVGSQDRVNYTALGDVVNLASRLEEANKVFGTNIIIGEATRSNLPRGYAIRRLGRIVVRGKKHHVRAYEVRGSSVTDDQLRLIAFRNALATYYRRRFPEAHAAFGELSRVEPAAEIYRARCEHLFAGAEVPADWDGSLRV
jgi:adenylate cyclase